MQCKLQYMCDKKRNGEAGFTREPTGQTVDDNTRSSIESMELYLINAMQYGHLIDVKYGNFQLGLSVDKLESIWECEAKECIFRWQISWHVNSTCGAESDEENQPIGCG